jgi:hypothetical protein
MSHHRHRHWHGCRQDCGCSLCAELDIHHPGEGVQLALAPASPEGARLLEARN